MFNWLIGIFMWISNFWEKMPNSAKEKIINAIVDTFEDIFREFYKYKKKETSD